MKISIHLDFEFDEDEIWFLENFFGSDPDRQFNYLAYIVSEQGMPRPSMKACVRVSSPGMENTFPFDAQLKKSRSKLEEMSIIQMDSLHNMSLTRIGKKIMEILPQAKRDQIIDDIIK